MGDGDAFSLAKDLLGVDSRMKDTSFLSLAWGGEGEAVRGQGSLQRPVKAVGAGERDYLPGGGGEPFQQ